MEIPYAPSGFLKTFRLYARDVNTILNSHKGSLKYLNQEKFVLQIGLERPDLLSAYIVAGYST